MKNTKGKKISPLNIKKRVAVLVGIAIVVLLAVFTIYYGKQAKDAPVGKSDPQLLYIRREVNTINYLQKDVVSLYLPLKIARQDKIKIFYDLMGPLGGFDPIAKPKEIQNIHAIINYLYGYTFNLFDFPLDEAGYSVTAPLRYENDFDAEAYFKENKQHLDNFAQTFLTDNSLTILGIGQSSIYRINNYFGDTKREFYWKTMITDKPYFSYKIVHQKDNSEIQTILELKKTYNSILQQMTNVDIQAMYKCEDKVIIIIDGLSDNAFGYVYHATDARDVNCGVLSGRFRIFKNQKMDGQWTYWAAK
ncbi:MAG TPA: hypothetical protein VLF89_03380 [Candidatus Saccharimonadales bacterium]|nr:hypothetical protein [Candidatus Saccharimonadales bacterium]